MTLEDRDLPGVWRDADRASLNGQRLTLRLNRLRLHGSIVGAVGGAFTWVSGWLNIWAAIAVVGFFCALIAEILLLTQKPGRQWHSGRVVAESVKTLAWRYSVCAAPFPSSLSENDARKVLRRRVDEIISKADPIALGPRAEVLISDGMELLRSAPFVVRKRAYIESRTSNQHKWYYRRAERNRRLAILSQVAMLLTELLALLMAVGRMLGRWDIDWSGILAASVTAVAAWANLKQYSALSSAYSIAATELALQVDELASSSEADWSRVVADAEEAISREHTMWLASRSSVAA